MKVGKSFSKANLFDKTVDTSDDVLEGTVQLFYPDGDKSKVSYLPVGANAYLEVPKLDTEPVVGLEGEMYYNLTSDKFFLVKGAAWVEVLFSMEEITI